MATETTRLLNGCVINIPKENDSLLNGNLTKGLSLEELLPFDSDPWWQNLRKTFFLSFWATIIVMFVAACIISILEHGACTPGTQNRNQLNKVIAATISNSTSGVNETIGGPSFAL